MRGSANAVDALIVVEGSNDQRAVERAVAPRRGCRILKGSYDAAAGHYDVPDVVIAKLAAAANDGARVVVLTDSDVAGRQMRGVVVREVPSALHAFLGTHLSSAKTDTATHKAGNVGVEHASVEGHTYRGRPGQARGVGGRQRGGIAPRVRPGGLGKVGTMRSPRRGSRSQVERVRRGDRAQAAGGGVPGRG